MFISSTASSAERPRQGAAAEWALSPLNVYSTETSPVPDGCPQAVEDALAHHKGFARDEFFGNSRPQHQCARQFVTLHQLFHRKRRDDVYRLA